MKHGGMVQESSRPAALRIEFLVLALLALMPTAAALVMDIRVFDLRIDPEALAWLLGLAAALFVCGLPFGYGRWRRRGEQAAVLTGAGLVAALFVTTAFPWPETLHEYALRFLTSPIAWLCLPIWTMLSCWFAGCTVLDGVAWFRRQTAAPVLRDVRDRTHDLEQRSAGVMNLLLATLVFTACFFVGYVVSS